MYFEYFSAIVQDVLPKISAQFESLKPYFTKIDRMEDLIVRVNSDLDVIGIFCEQTFP